MGLSRNNILGGPCVAALATGLLSQTFGGEDALGAEGIHPMDYPRVLIFILFGLSILIAVRPAAISETKSAIPILSWRTASTALVLLLFALLLNTVGFAASAFVCSSLTAVIMGWRNYKVLLAVNAFGCPCIWALFTLVLNIPVPTGSFW